MKRNLSGRFSKKQHFKLPYQDNLKVILPFVFLLIISNTGTYVAEAKAFHHNFLIYLYEPKTITIENSPVYRTPKIPQQNVGRKDERNQREQPRDTIRRVAREEGYQGWERLLDVEEKIRNVFFEEPNTAVAIGKAESRLNSSKVSETDITLDGKPFSIGAMQINLTVHSLDGVACHKAFLGRDYQAIVINEQLYDKCVELAKDVNVNLRTSRRIYEERDNFTAWGSYTNLSYLEFL